MVGLQPNGKLLQLSEAGAPSLEKAHVLMLFPVLGFFVTHKGTVEPPVGYSFHCDVRRHEGVRFRPEPWAEPV